MKFEFNPRQQVIKQKSDEKKENRHPVGHNDENVNNFTFDYEMITSRNL